MYDSSAEDDPLAIIDAGTYITARKLIHMWKYKSRPMSRFYGFTLEAVDAITKVLGRHSSRVATFPSRMMVQLRIVAMMWRDRKNVDLRVRAAHTQKESRTTILLELPLLGRNNCKYNI